MSIGNATLDSDHKDMLELIREIDCAIKAKDHSVLSQNLRQLSVCMNRHFLREELLAYSRNIPFALHKTAHQNIRDEIILTRHQLEKEGVVTVHMEHYAQFLHDWVINHITVEDMQLKPVLQTYPYDFMIDEWRITPTA